MPLSDDAARRKDLWGASYRDFQHRHYAGIAGIIAKLPIDIRDRVARGFAGAFDRNRNFDARRFLIAAAPPLEDDNDQKG